MKKLQVCCCFVGLCLLGCSSKGETSAALEQAAQESTEQRLERLEAQMATLDQRVDTLGDTTYEVRTRSGKSTSMIVVPRSAAETTASKSKAAPAPVRKATSAPAGRVINPEAQPAPFPRPQQAAAPAVAVAAKSGAAEKAAARPAPARQGASGSIGTPDRIAGPSGSIAPDPAATAAPAGVQDLALPPSEAPVPDVSHLRSLEQDKATPLTPVPPRTAVGQPAPSASAVPAVPAIPDAGSAVPNIAVTPAAPAAPAAKAAPAPAPQKAAPAPRAAKGEKAAYDQALRTLNSGRTADGIAQFQSFLQQYPQGRYAANAHYWIGEGYYSQGKLQDALQQFQTVNQSFPRHHKTADALLKAGMTMNRLGDAQGAKQQYQQVIDRFPNSQAARRARGLIR